MKEQKLMDGEDTLEIGSVSFFVNMAPAAHLDPDFEQLATREVEAWFREALGARGLGEQVLIAYTESCTGCVIVTVGLAIASSLAVEFIRKFSAYRSRINDAGRELNGRETLPKRGGGSVWLYRDDLDRSRARIFAENVYILENHHMGDTYNVGQAGAVGSNARSDHNTFQQVWQQSQGTIDLPALTAELGRLRGELQSRAKEPEQLVAAGQVAAAEIEARKGGGAKLLEHLKAAGSWALDVAKDIGAEIAAKVIMKSLGLPG